MDKYSDLKQLFYDPSKGLDSINKLYKAVKGKYTKKEVEEFVKAQKSYQLFAKPPKPVSIPITARDVGFYQVDLLDFSKYSGYNNGYKWILIAIDIKSRYAWAVAMRDKKADTVLEAVKTLPIPHSWTSDNGSEFTNNMIKSWFAANGIDARFAEPGDHNKLGIVDRFSRTLRSKITKYFASSDGFNWVDALISLVSSYNNSVHRTIGVSPSSIYSGSSKAPEVKLDLGLLESLNRIKVGDKVRVRNVRTKFTKGTDPIWSDDVYLVTGREGNKYRLSNGNLVGINNLLVVQDVAISQSESWNDGTVRKPIRLHEEIGRMTKLKRVGEELKRDGIDQKNIVSGPRVRKPVRTMNF